jgi:hypothetical protein
MIRDDNQKGNDTMSNATEYGVVKVGQNITATRQDGRVFEGSIVNVRAFAKGTMVTVVSSAPASYYDNYSGRDITVNEPVYKNIYLEDCKSWVVWENEEMYWKG